MAKDSKIEWTHHTFNPWWGCSKVSPACDNCYAETWAKRVGSNVWGRNSERRFFGSQHWKEPLKWNKEALISGERRRVFCASMADVFEKRANLNPWRVKLWRLIEQTPGLDWLLLTKRPQNIASMVPWKESWPENVWLGTTVENQRLAEIRIQFLLEHSAKIRFLSCEPLLGPLNLKAFFNVKNNNSVDWVIAGGESGPKSRPMQPNWISALKDQCQKANVPFHFKQWGHWVPVELLTDVQKNIVEIDGQRLAPVGKAKAGRSLEGKEWDEFPLASVVSRKFFT